MRCIVRIERFKRSKKFYVSCYLHIIIKMAGLVAEILRRGLEQRYCS